MEAMQTPLVKNLFALFQDRECKQVCDHYQDVSVQHYNGC